MQSEEVPFTSFNATTGEVTWLGDTGAGRNISGIKGINPDVIGLSNNPVTFATGSGSRSGSGSCQVVGELTGSNECYWLKDSPWALSIGDQVRQGKAFIELPSSSEDIAKNTALPKCPEHAARVVMPVKFEKTLNRLAYCIWPLKLPNLLMEKCPVKNPTDTREVSFLMVY